MNPVVSFAKRYSLVCAACNAKQTVAWEYAMGKIGDNKPMLCLLCQSKGKSGVLIPGPSETLPERN